MLRTTTDLVSRCISTAIASASTVWMPMLMITYLNVIPSAFQNSASCSSALVVVEADPVAASCLQQVEVR